MYGLYLYFLGLSFREYRAPLTRLSTGVTRPCVWKGVQTEVRAPPGIRCQEGPGVPVDETYVKVGSFEAWIWVDVEPVHRYILGVYLSRHQNMIVAKLFLNGLVKRHGKHVVYSDGGTWYPEACSALELGHRLHSQY